MRSLSALRPAAGLCPVKFDGLELVELDLSYLFSISPFPGFEKNAPQFSKKTMDYICQRFAELREIQG